MDQNRVYYNVFHGRPFTLPFAKRLNSILDAEKDVWSILESHNYGFIVFSVYGYGELSLPELILRLGDTTLSLPQKSATIVIEYDKEYRDFKVSFGLNLENPVFVYYTPQIMSTILEAIMPYVKNIKFYTNLYSLDSPIYNIPTEDP